MSTTSAPVQLSLSSVLGFLLDLVKSCPPGAKLKADFIAVDVTSGSCSVVEQGATRPNGTAALSTVLRDAGFGGNVDITDPTSGEIKHVVSAADHQRYLLRSVLGSHANVTRQGSKERGWLEIAPRTRVNVVNDLTSAFITSASPTPKPTAASIPTA